VGSTDVDAARYPGDTAAAAKCREIMEAAGEDTTVAATFSHRFAPSQDRWLAGSLVRDFLYDADCSCFTYVDRPPRPV
jgi:hypothetical protein